MRPLSRGERTVILAYRGIRTGRNSVFGSNDRLHICEISAKRIHAENPESADSNTDYTAGCEEHAIAARHTENEAAQKI